MRGGDRSPRSARCFPYGGVSDAATTLESTVVSVGVGLRPLLVDVKQAARLLGIGRTTLYELINEGAITPVRIGRCVRFPVSDLEQFVADGCVVRPSTEQPSTVAVGSGPKRPARRSSRRADAPSLFEATS